MLMYRNPTSQLLQTTCQGPMFAHDLLPFVGHVRLRIAIPAQLSQNHAKVTTETTETCSTVQELGEKAFSRAPISDIRKICAHRIREQLDKMHWERCKSGG